MRLTIEIDDDEIRNVLAPLIHWQAALPNTSASTRLLTVKDVASELGVSRGTVYSLVNRGDIRSVAIGRTRPVPLAALAEFIANPMHPRIDVVAETARPPRSRLPAESAPEPMTTGSAERTSRRTTQPDRIDLFPRPKESAGYSSQMMDSTWDELCGGLEERGWPTDIVDQIRADHKEGIERLHILTIREAARYLGLSTGSVDKLITAGKLRLFTIVPAYRDEKSLKRIPSKDVLALIQGS